MLKAFASSDAAVQKTNDDAQTSKAWVACLKDERERNKKLHSKSHREWLCGCVLSTYIRRGYWAIPNSASQCSTSGIFDLPTNLNKETPMLEVTARVARLAQVLRGMPFVKFKKEMSFLEHAFDLCLRLSVNCRKLSVVLYGIATQGIASIKYTAYFKWSFIYTKQCLSQNHDCCLMCLIDCVSHPVKRLLNWWS